MKKIYIVILTFLSINLIAQENETKEIMRVIDNVFGAMRKNDSTLLKTSFVNSPNTFTAFFDKEGRSQLIPGNFQRFVHAIGQPKDQVWNEPIWNEKVEIDGNLASVWVDYAFYIDDQFSHCGVDAFHLIKQDDGWKIFHLVDTRRKDDCEVPDEFKP
ncbi:MAG: nuclear transport factor 2 family protein [Bacteroidota bacterium]